HLTTSPETLALSLHDALPISKRRRGYHGTRARADAAAIGTDYLAAKLVPARIAPGGVRGAGRQSRIRQHGTGTVPDGDLGADSGDRKSTRLNSSHVSISYAVF